MTWPLPWADLFSNTDWGQLRRSIDWNLVLATIAILVTFVLARAIRQEKLARPQGIANAAQFLRTEYVDSPFPDRPSTLNSKSRRPRVKTLAEARNSLAEGYGLTDWTNGKDKRSRLPEFWARSLEEKKGTWENQVAYRLSLPLESMGILCLAGNFPLDILLAYHETQIVRDWFFCHRLVTEHIRPRNQITLKPRGKGSADSAAADQVSLQRRHGEWLAMAAMVHMWAKWKSDELTWIVERLGGMDSIRNRERVLRKEARSLMSPLARKQIARIVGRSSWVRRPEVSDSASVH